MITVTLGIALQDSALVAIRATTSLTAPVSSQILTTLNPLTLAAELGTGTIKCALNALKTGSLTLMVSASQSATTVPLTTLMDCALLVSRVTTSLTAPVSSQILTTLNPLTLAAELGTGTTKCALSALKTGSSTLMVFVLP